MNRVSLPVALVAMCFVSSASLAQVGPLGAQSAEQKLQRLAPWERANAESNAKKLGIDLKALAAQEAAAAEKVLAAKRAETLQRMRLENARLHVATLEKEIKQRQLFNPDSKYKEKELALAKKQVAELEAQIKASAKGSEQPKAPVPVAMDAKQLDATIKELEAVVKKINEAQRSVVSPK